MKKKLNQKKFSEILFRDFPHVVFHWKDDCLLLEGFCDSWEQVIDAGYLAAKVRSGGVINQIHVQGLEEKTVRISPIIDQAYEGLAMDVLVIGGGVIGCSILRELCKYDISAVLLEKENDVALHASSHNDGCIHPGVDLNTHSLKYHYLRKAVPMYKTLARDLNFDYWETGQTVVFEKKSLRVLGPLMRLLFARKGNPDMKIWNGRKVHQVAPGISEHAQFALHFPRGAVVSPYQVTIAFAENAIENGARILLDTAALEMETSEGKILNVQTNRGTLFPKVVINAAGVFADKIAAMASDQFFTIHPREGLDIIFDKKVQSKLTHTTISIYESKKNRGKTHTKGGGLVPTTDGNLLAGPTAKEVFERENFETDMPSVFAVVEKHKRTIPALSMGDVITYFSGIRAATYEEDFVIRKGKWTHNIVHAAGIQSPGLTAAPAIAEDIAKISLEILGGNIPKKPHFKNTRDIDRPLKDMNPEQRHLKILSNPDYGQIVCRCEEISKGEIIDAVHRPLPAITVDAIKRRVRPGMGRCQGGFCQPLVLQIMANEYHIPLESIAKKGHGKILFGDTKGETHGTV